MNTTCPIPVKGTSFYEDVQIVRNAGYAFIGARNDMSFPKGHTPSHSFHYGHQCRHLFIFTDLQGYMTLDSGD